MSAPASPTPPPERRGTAGLDGADPVRVVAAVATAPLVAEAVVALADLDGAVALVVRLAGVVAAVLATTSFVVRPLLRAAARARMTASDLGAELAEERAARDFRDRFDRAIGAADGEPAALRTGLRAVMEVVPEHDVSLLLAAPGEDRLAWAVRMANGTLQPAEPIPHRPACHALGTGTTTVTPSSVALDACPHLGDPALEVSSVCVPFRLGDRSLGSVCVTGPPGEPPGEDAIRTIGWVVDRTAARVAEQRRSRGPAVPGPLDPVTGLPTEPALRGRLRDLVRSLTPFSVAVVRLDGEEAYRTEHGAGVDDALRLLAGMLTTTLRPDDVVCRLDGARFAAVLERCTADQASAAMERVRESLVLALTLDDVAHFTCSAGIVESHRATSLDETVALADAACDVALLRGGNRVSLADT
jgi:diguanylate cyclase (GGDEF)-like protein